MLNISPGSTLSGVLIKITLPCNTVSADMNMRPNSGSSARGPTPSPAGPGTPDLNVSAVTARSSAVAVNPVNATSVISIPYDLLGGVNVTIASTSEKDKSTSSV